MAELSIRLREDIGLVTIMARRGIGADQIGARLGVPAPTAPAWRQGDDGLSLIGYGPDTWLGHVNRPDPFWADMMRERLNGLASVSDQSSGYVVFRLSGADARTILQRGLPIDLHPEAFGPGSAAASAISHVSVILWQVDDAPSYDVATFRSFSGSFRHWLDQAAVALCTAKKPR